MTFNQAKSGFLERILMEHIELICSLESKLTLMSICSIRIRSRKRDIIQKPILKSNFLNPFEEPNSTTTIPAPPTPEHHSSDDETEEDKARKEKFEKNLEKVRRRKEREKEEQKEREKEEKKERGNNSDDF